MGREKKYITLAVLILFLIVIKLLILLTSINQVYIYEELLQGTVARALMKGPHLPIIYYQSSSYAGGGLIVGMLTVPFFYLFGENLFSLKLVTLLFSTGILTVMFLFLDEYFNRRIAVLSSLLFILSPKSFTIRSLQVWGDHYDSIFFTFLIIICFYYIFFRPFQYKKFSSFSFILFGFISGFAAYYSYASLVVIFVCLFLWFMFDKRFFLKRSFVIFILFAVIGFSPGIFYNFTHNFQGLSRHGEPLYKFLINSNLSESLYKFINILFGRFEILTINPGTISMHKDASALLIHFVFLFSFLLLSEDISKKAFKSKETLFFIYPFIYFLIFIFSNMNKQTYLFAMYPFAVIVICLSLDRLWIKKSLLVRGGAFLCTTTLVTIGLFGNLRLLFRDKAIGEAFIYRGYDYRVFGQCIGWDLASKVEKSNSIIENNVEDKYKFFFYEGFGEKIGCMAEKGTLKFDDDIKKFIKTVNKINKKYRHFAYKSLGYNIGWRVDNNIEELSELLKQVDERYRPYCYEGIGWNISIRLGVTFNRLNKDYIVECVRLINKITPTYRQYVYFGLGRKLGHRMFGWDSLLQPTALIGNIDQEYRYYAFKGFGWSIGEKFEEDPKGYMDLISKVDKKYIYAIYEGIGWCLGWMYGEEGCDKFINRIEEEFRVHCYKGLQLYSREKAGNKFLLTKN